MRWVTYSRQPMDDRAAAVDRMLADDPGAFWSDCAAKTRQIDDWPMIRLLAEKAEASGDIRALPWLVRSWAMPSKLVADKDRPERQAIVSITSSEQCILRSIVFDPATAYQPATQVAAWSVMTRIEPEGRLRSYLADSSESDQSLLVVMLRRVAPALDVLPSDRLAVAQMMWMTVAYPDAQWAAWTRWRAEQRGDGLATLDLRHIPALKHRDTKRDDWDRERWLSHVASRLADRRHASRGEGANSDIVVKQRPDRFADHAPALGVADLIVLDHLLDVMGDAGFKRVAFEQAEADRIDQTSELGGAVIWDKQGKVLFKPFAPLMRRHDQAYIAPTSCIEAVYLGLAHVHFHTQRYDNASWAGPGKGDLDFASAHHVNAIVLTFLDPSTLNLDVYFPGGVTIDLGCLTR